MFFQTLRVYRRRGALHLLLPSGKWVVTPMAGAGRNGRLLLGVFSKDLERRSQLKAEQFDTVVIGGGQAGLAMGYYLNELQRDFTKEVRAWPREDLQLRTAKRW